MAQPVKRRSSDAASVCSSARYSTCLELGRVRVRVTVTVRVTVRVRG